MTLNVHRLRDQKRCVYATVSFNGIDVTDRCFYADSRRGVVRLYRLDADGRKFIKNGAVAKEERRGHVRIRIGKE